MEQTKGERGGGREEVRADCREMQSVGACLKRGNDEILSSGGREQEINDCEEKMRQERRCGVVGTEEISLNQI